jgi:hypothetical protein
MGIEAVRTVAKGRLSGGDPASGMKDTTLRAKGIDVRGERPDVVDLDLNGCVSAPRPSVSRLAVARIAGASHWISRRRTVLAPVITTDCPFLGVNEAPRTAPASRQRVFGPSSAQMQGLDRQRSARDRVC